MLNFATEQTVVEVGHVKVGGQPGEQEAQHQPRRQVREHIHEAVANGHDETARQGRRGRGFIVTTTMTFRTTALG